MTLDEDDMLQYAIEQSLVESSGGACGIVEEDTDKVDIWEALRGQGVGAESALTPDEDAQIQRCVCHTVINNKVKISL